MGSEVTRSDDGIRRREKFTRASYRGVGSWGENGGHGSGCKHKRREARDMKTYTKALVVSTTCWGQWRREGEGRRGGTPLSRAICYYSPPSPRGRKVNSKRGRKAKRQIWGGWSHFHDDDDCFVDHGLQRQRLPMRTMRKLFPGND